MRVHVRILFALAAVLSPMAVFGQTSGSSGVKEETPEEEKTVQLILYPAPEPRPALKYHLLPPFLERRPGNAAVWWNRLPAEMRGFFNEFYKEGGAWGMIEKWMEIPLSDPREREYREKEHAKDFHYLRDSSLFSDMQRAARFESCDWELPLREGNFVGILLPEMQESRTYARLLAGKARLEIAEGKYDEAVRTLQSGFALARHVADAPILVSGLIGVSEASMMCEQVQQWIQRPDGPNLYWAISTLPRPLVDFRLAGETESNLLYLQSPELQDLDKKTLSPEGWRDLLNKTVTNFSGIFGRHVSPEAASAEVIMSAIQGYPRAKRYLIERGRSAAEVEAMPVAQIVLLYSVAIVDEYSDQQFKWFFLPMAEAGKGPERAQRHLMETCAKREIIPFVGTLLPAITAVKMAETRLQWKLAMLRVFEAMRLYAANHDGRWPDQLSDVTEVPIPANPIDGKAFIYQRHGGKVLVTSEKGPMNAPWRYEITLMRKER